MDVTQFEDIQAEFMRRVTAAIYCTMATVDSQGRPRSRIMHPVWDGPVGWVISWPQSHKAKHLRDNPYVSLAYIHDRDKPVYADCLAEWVNTASEKQRIWDLHKLAPAPLGFDPKPHYDTVTNPYFGLLKFSPWRVELAQLEGEPLIWRPYRNASS